MREIKKGICSFCRLGCELGIVTEGWNIKGMEYLKGSGLNDGSLCPRGNAAAIYLDHPKRLVFPLRDGKEISWKEAFSELADMLKKTDAGELAITYDSNLTQEEYSLVWKFAEKMGVENLASSYLEPEFYFTHTIPEVPKATLEEIKRSSIFIIVGDVFNQMPVISRHILEAKYRSKKGRIYVIDSYITHTASFADIFVQVKPGMEGLALLALSSLVSKGAGQLPSDEYIDYSGVESAALKEVAQALGEDEKKVVIAVTAFGRSENPLLLSGSTQYLTTQLPGDKAFLPLGESFSRVGKVEFTDVLGRIESGEIRVLINFGEVFPHMYPQLSEKLRNLSHLVSTTVLKTAPGNIPGLCLPTTLNLEKSGSLDTAFGVREISPVVAPASGAKSIGEIVETVAEELSLSLSREKLSIPQRMVALDPLKAIADRLLQGKKNGFVLVGEKLAYHFHSFFGEDHCLRLNPIEAGKLGTKDGELIKLKTSRAQTDLKLITTNRVPPGLVVVPVESPDVRALFESSVDEKVVCFKPQPVELWKEKA